MHAMIVTVKLDRNRKDEQTTHLRERIVPTVRSAPGFVAGYWAFDDVTGKGHSFAVFETEEAAKKMVAAMQANIASQDQGVEVEHVTTGAIQAEARVA